MTMNEGRQMSSHGAVHALLLVHLARVVTWTMLIRVVTANIYGK